jgi:hypothetical protein
MKAAEWKKVVKPLLPADENWQFRGSSATAPRFAGSFSGCWGSDLASIRASTSGN